MINRIRNFAYTMNNAVPRKIFFLRNFAPKRYAQFNDLMYTLNTDYQLGLITEEHMDSVLESFLFHPLSLTLTNHK